MMAIEGITDAAVLMHGPEGCRRAASVTSMKVYPREDNSVNMMTQYYFGVPRVPCTDMESSDYIFGAFERMYEALQYIKERNPRFIAIVCSPGASLIGDDCQKALDDSGLSDMSIVLDAELSSKPINVGIDLTMVRVMEKIAPKSAETRKGTAVLLGNHILHKDWESVNEEMTKILELMGIEVICCPGAGSPVRQLRESVAAEYAIVVCPEYAQEFSKFYHDRYGAVVVNPDCSPIGFEATENWIRLVAEKTGHDPSKALAYVDGIKKKAYRRMLAATFDTDSFGFEIDAEPSIAYPLCKFFYDNLQMVPRCIRYNDTGYGPSEKLMDSFLEKIGMKEVLGAEDPEYVEIFCSDGNTADLHERSHNCLRGVDMRFPSSMDVDFLSQPLFGAQGALYILERVVNRF